MDLVMLGGTILTMDGMNRRHEALAVRNCKIAAVGATEEISKLVGQDTQVVHLAGRTVVPGFIDPHNHFSMTTFEPVSVDCRMPPLDGKQDVLDAIASAARGGGRLGFPFVKVRAELYDGKSHDVDSSNMAFEAAGMLAFRLASEGNATLLEPIMRIEVESPEEYTGDVIGDLSSRRGVVEEMITKPGGLTTVTGKVPLTEMFQYSTSLRSSTQGRGHYSMEPFSYESVPPNIAEKILDDY